MRVMTKAICTTCGFPAAWHVHGEDRIGDRRVIVEVVKDPAGELHWCSWTGRPTPAFSSAPRPEIRMMTAEERGASR